MSLDEIKLYLPKYLSDQSHNALIDSLRKFPDIPTDRFYTTKLQSNKEIYQGDGLRDLIVINLPDVACKRKECMVLSNTCDIHGDNERAFPIHLIYSPIINLAKYLKILEEEGLDGERLRSHEDAIRKQYVTQILFLPAISNRLDDSVVLLDRILNLPTSEIDVANLEEQRIFTLSDTGHFLFVFKISYHFTRIRDGVDRG